MRRDEGQLEGLAIEFDHDGDGIADGTTLTDSDGAFVYEPHSIAVGAQTIHARAVLSDEAGYRRFGDWQAFAFTRSANEGPVLSRIGLSRDTGSRRFDGITADATLVGEFTDSTPTGGYRVEFDWNADGAPDDAIDDRRPIP